MFGEIYEHSGSYNYLVIKGKEEKYQGYGDRILQENTLSGLLPIQYRYLDGVPYFYYKINSLQSLNQVLERRKLKYGELAHILREIDKNIQEMEQYLLGMEKIVLLPEYIFMDFDLEHLYLCYYPDYEENTSFEKLASFFVDCVDYKDNKVVELAYSFHGKIMEKNSVFTEVVKKVLDVQEVVAEPVNMEIEDCNYDYNFEDCKKEKMEENRKVLYAGMGILGAEAVVFFWFRLLALYQGICIFIITGALYGYILWSQRKGKTDEKEEYEITLAEYCESEREAVYAEPIGETVFLSRNDEMEKHSLIYQGREKVADFELKVFPFVIGKAEQGVDGTIGLPLISRLHCQINYENGIYEIQDLNSTNGTYVNGKLLLPKERVKLQPGDRILLANQPFVFQ